MLAHDTVLVHTLAVDSPRPVRVIDDGLGHARASGASESGGLRHMVYPYKEQPEKSHRVGGSWLLTRITTFDYLSVTTSAFESGVWAKHSHQM